MKKLIATVAAFCLCASVSAYEEETHEQFANNTSNADEYINDTLGFNLRETHTYVDRDGRSNPQQLKFIRTRGSFREDDGSRPKNHFYDPNDNSTMTLLSLAGGFPTPDWAIEDSRNVEGNLTAIPSQNYSLSDAKEYGASPSLAPPKR